MVRKTVTPQLRAGGRATHAQKQRCVTRSGEIDHLFQFNPTPKDTKRMDATIIAIILAPIMAIFGFMLRRLFMRLSQVKTETEIRMLLEDRLAPLKVRQSDFQDDISRIERKLDKILDIMIHEKR